MNWIAAIISIILAVIITAGIDWGRTVRLFKRGVENEMQKEEP